jgi:hypothetical protein
MFKEEMGRACSRHEKREDETNRMGYYGLDSAGPGWGQEERSCEYRNEASIP